MSWHFNLFKTRFGYFFHTPISEITGQRCLVDWRLRPFGECGFVLFFETLVCWKNLPNSAHFCGCIVPLLFEMSYRWMNQRSRRLFQEEAQSGREWPILFTSQVIVNSYPSLPAKCKFFEVSEIYYLRNLRKSNANDSARFLVLLRVLFLAVQFPCLHQLHHEIR